ncbi:MAG: AraC family ligand binding domain-containing protein, partial [Chitinophagaceae bacterium]|nr:AraC family ligand binding domain-containing protein [Chitinophagaceae bacterium]
MPHIMEMKKDGYHGQKAIEIPATIISAYCLKNPLVAGAYITNIGYYSGPPSHYRVYHKGIDQHILVYNTAGEGWMEIDDQRYDIRPGDFFIAPAGKHNCYASSEKKPWTIYWLHFKGPMADAAVASFYEQNHSYLGNVSFNQHRLKIFDKMYQHLECGFGYDTLTHVNMILPQFLNS